MLKDRRAFIFDRKYFSESELPSIKSGDYQITKSFNNDIEGHIQVATHGILLIPAIETITHFYCERMKTKQLEKRLKYKKKALDAMVEEASYQAEIQIEEYRKRKEEEIKYNKKMLEASIENLKIEAEYIKKKNIDDYMKNKKIKSILDESRKQIKDNLDIVANLIEYGNENELNRNKYYNQLNEEYRKQLREYRNLIGKVI